MGKKRNDNGPPNNGAVKSPEAAATYFLSLTLRNARCFGDEAQSLDLSDGDGRPAQWTVLLGNNGTGKTTVLQALAGFEIMKPDRPQKENGPHRDGDERPGDPRFERFPLEYFIRSVKKDTVLVAKIATGGLLSKSDPKYSPIEPQWEMNADGTYSWGPTTDESRRTLKCYGYGASRRLSLPSLSAKEPDDTTANLFFDDAPLRNAEEWLLQLDYSSRIPSEVQDQQKRQAKLVRELLIEILPEIEDIRFTPPTAERRTPLIEFQTKYGWVPLRQLGHGYRTLIAWMVDFVSRLVDRFPDSPNPLEAPAVVLVDEIDLHMHPLWQRQLMHYLTTCFPNTQFIVTAHSPLIIQAAAEDANIAVLRREDDHVIIDNDMGKLRGYSVDQLLTTLFDLPSARPPQYDEVFKRREQLLGKAKLNDKEKGELAELNNKVDELPLGESPQQRQMLAELRESLKLLKQNQRKAQ